jgi:hypothetical protein
MLFHFLIQPNLLLKKQSLTHDRLQHQEGKVTIKSQDIILRILMEWHMTLQQLELPSWLQNLQTRVAKVESETTLAKLDWPSLNEVRLQHLQQLVNFFILTLYQVLNVVTAILLRRIKWQK